MNTPTKRIIINWRTSGGGVASVILGLVNIIKAIAGNDDLDATFLTTNVGLIITGISLIFARDSAVTSEQSGVTPSASSIKDAEKVP